MNWKKNTYMEKIMPNRLDRGFEKYQTEFENKALEVLRSGWYVLGNEVEKFEEEFAAYLGAKYCVGLASGLDALWIAFKILGMSKNNASIRITEWIIPNWQHPPKNSRPNNERPRFFMLKNFFMYFSCLLFLFFNPLFYFFTIERICNAFLL